MPTHITVKPVYSGTARDRNFSVAGRFRNHTCTWSLDDVWLVGSPDPQECKTFSLKTGFRYFRVPFKTGFTLFSGYPDSRWWCRSSFCLEILETTGLHGWINATLCPQQNCFNIHARDRYFNFQPDLCHRVYRQTSILQQCELWIETSGERG